MEIIAFLSGVISLITLIVFFIMSSNVSKIKKIVEGLKHKEQRNNFGKPYKLGQLKEFQGKKQDALDCYMEAFFYLNDYIKKNPTDEMNLENKQLILSKIEALGGSINDLI